MRATENTLKRYAKMAKDDGIELEDILNFRQILMSKYGLSREDAEDGLMGKNIPEIIAKLNAEWIDSIRSWRKKQDAIREISVTPKMQEAMLKQIEQECVETMDVTITLYDGKRVERYYRRCPNCHTKIVSTHSTANDKYCRECGQKVRIIPA